MTNEAVLWGVHYSPHDDELGDLLSVPLAHIDCDEVAQSLIAEGEDTAFTDCWVEQIRTKIARWNRRGSLDIPQFHWELNWVASDSGPARWNRRY